MKKMVFSVLMVSLVIALFAGFAQQQENIKNVRVRQRNGGAGLNATAANDFAASVNEPVLLWNSFLGGNEDDNGYRIAIDSYSNLYVWGWSESSWGRPLNPFGGGSSDAFVAKLNSNGVLQWHTFLGGSGDDHGGDIVIDASGNIYVTGISEDSWGSPINSFSGGRGDIFVAKLNSNGARLWHTFLGGSGWESVDSLLIGGSKNIYVVGYSESTWGTPVNPFGGGSSDTFVAKLNSNGIRQWNTFLGGNDTDSGIGIVADGSENIYVAGGSKSAWGSPVNPFGGGDYDAFTAKLNPNGVLLWHTFMGGGNSDTAVDIIMDGKGNIYTLGHSLDTWGSPVNPFGGGYNDAFVAKLKSDGVRQWHTFLGGNDIDFANGIALEGSENIVVTGYSHSTWGSPVNPFGGGDSDVFAAKLNSNGVRQWHTFLGGSAIDSNSGIVPDESGNIYVAGHSSDTWGSPVNPFGGGDSDVFAAKLNSNGVRQWHTFLGGSEWEFNNAIVLGERGNIYMTGKSNGTWGSPIYPFSGDEDAFVARVIDVEALLPYEITLNRENLYFGATWNETPHSQTFMVGSNTSVPVVPIWSISGDQTWLSCNPTTGTGPGLVTVSVNPEGLAAGTYTGIITVTDPKAVNSPQMIQVTFKVYIPGQTIVPFGQYSTPADGSLVSGSVPFTGWALDDIGVESVKIYWEEGINFNYIGDAVFIEGARPDVEQAYPGYPMNYSAGWGYMMLTNFLPNSGNGTFAIAAIATDREGNQVTLGSKLITVDNAHAVKPFGAIDTPLQGGNAAGSSYRNWGWVLTPSPNLVPTDGATINVWVDGVEWGHPKYNLYRPDVAFLFPGYANSDGAGGYFDIDTTAYDNGIHSIFWTAADNAGNADGIGSRYFSILDTGSSHVSAVSAPTATKAVKTKRSNSPGYKDIIAVPLSNDDPVKLKKGYTDGSLAEEVSPDADGVVPIRCRELERIELRVSQAGNQVEGYLVVGQRLKRLPIGSTLDSRTGTFYWIPGPGFIGTYRLVFVETDGQGEQTRKEIRITIEPKSFRE